MGNRDGTFQLGPGGAVFTNQPISGYAIISGDLNGDGKADLILSSPGDPHGVTVLMGGGDGTFTASAIATTGIFISAIRDVNGDEIPA